MLKAERSRCVFGAGIDVTKQQVCHCAKTYVTPYGTPVSRIREACQRRPSIQSWFLNAIHREPHRHRAERSLAGLLQHA